MATLIPAISICLSCMTNGEKRFAWRLEDKLEDDYLCWYGVSIGEGYDFKQEWFKLVVQMIHPYTDSPLVLYDAVQLIYDGPNKLHFSVSSVGGKANGRTTILKPKYCNIAEILAVARTVADDLQSPSDTEDDQASTVQSISAGRRRPKPLLTKLPGLKDEATYLTNRLKGTNTLTLMSASFQWQQDKKQKFEPFTKASSSSPCTAARGWSFGWYACRRSADRLAMSRYWRTTRTT